MKKQLILLLLWLVFVYLKTLKQCIIHMYLYSFQYLIENKYEFSYEVNFHGWVQGSQESQGTKTEGIIRQGFVIVVN